MLNNPKPGPSSVSEYLISGLPWVTSSAGDGIRKFSFPYATIFFTVKNNLGDGATPLHVGFTNTGILSGNYIPVSGTQSFTSNIRVRELFVSGNTEYSGDGSVTVLAGLTTIRSQDFPIISGAYTGA